MSAATTSTEIVSRWTMERNVSVSSLFLQKQQLNHHFRFLCRTSEMFTVLFSQYRIYKAGGIYRQNDEFTLSG